MSCSVFVHIKCSKELEEKIRKISGIIPKTSYSHFEVVNVPEELFPQHKKEAEAHRWVTKEGQEGYYHHSTNPGEWQHLSHGFEIWIGFIGDDGEKDIVLVVPCHWDPDHGHWTLIDLEEWIKTNLGEVKIKEQKVTH